MDILVLRAIEAIGLSAEPPSLREVARTLDVHVETLRRAITAHGVTDVTAWIAEQHSLALVRMAERRQIRDKILEKHNVPFHLTRHFHRSYVSPPERLPERLRAAPTPPRRASGATYRHDW